MTEFAAAQAGIMELHSRYTDAVLRHDYDAFAECFTEDGEWRISGRVFCGRAEIKAAISTILDQFIRVLITFRTPILEVGDGRASGRSYIDEKCAWKNGNTNISVGRYYEHFVLQDGRWYFEWRLFEMIYRGDPDMTGTFFDPIDCGPPPAMPPRDAVTEDMASTRWGLSSG